MNENVTKVWTWIGKNIWVARTAGFILIMLFIKASIWWFAPEMGAIYRESNKGIATIEDRWKLYDNTRELWCWDLNKACEGGCVANPIHTAALQQQGTTLKQYCAFLNCSKLKGLAKVECELENK